jgi:hypothetical protein
LIPTFNRCLICDIVRPELRGKAIVIGMYGICPNVDIQLQQLDRAIPLSFLLSGTPGDTPVKVEFEIVDPTEERVIARSGEMNAYPEPGSTTTLVFVLLATFGHAGTFVGRCLVNGEPAYQESFEISAPKVALP